MKYSYLFLPMLLAFLFFAACSDSPEGGNPAPEPEPEPEPAPAPFVITVSGETTWTADIVWTPSSDDESYVAMIVDKASFDQYATDDEYIAGDIEYFRQLAEYFETDFETILAKYTFKGTSRQRAAGLKSDTEYYAYAFGITQDGTATTELIKTAFKTAAVHPVDCEFDITATQVGTTTARVYITPTDKTCTYFWDCVSREEYDKFGDDAGVIATNIDLIERAVEIFQMAGQDKTFADFLNSDVGYSDLTQLKGDTEYVVFAFGLDPSGTATTAVEKKSFRTAPAASSSMTFTTELLSLTFNGAKIAFRPSNDSETYFTDCIDHETYGKYGSDTEFMNWIVSEAGSSMSSFLTSGYHVVDASRMLRSQTRYVAYAFGYSGGITTGMTKEEFTTPAMPTGGKATVEITPLIEDGNNYYDRDEIMYANYKDKAVVQYALTPSGDAAHWYIAAFKSSISGYDDLLLAEMLQTAGYEDKQKIGMLAAWGTEIPVAAVAVDSDGRAGSVKRLSVRVEKSAAPSAAPSSPAKLYAPLECPPLRPNVAARPEAKAMTTLRQQYSSEIAALKTAQSAAGNFPSQPRIFLRR